MSTLGAGVNTAWLYDQNGRRRIAALDENVAGLEWNRNLNAISTASVSLLTGQHAECCDVLGQVGTWGHSLVFFRDGVRVWEGPITSIRMRRGSVVLGAHDVLGWTMKRVVTSAKSVPTPLDVMGEAWEDLLDAFLVHDPNVTNYIDVHGPSPIPTVTRDVKAYGGYYDDGLRELVKGGLRFTVVGRRIILWHTNMTLATLPPLVTGEHMSGDVEVYEDGLGLATGAAAANDEGVAGSYNLSTLDSFYGVVQSLVPNDAVTSGSLDDAAEQHVAAHYPAPVAINVPQGSVLDCDAPYPIQTLVPGSSVTVKALGMCRRVEETQVLSGVKVTQDEQGEKVAITLSRGV